MSTPIVDKLRTDANDPATRLILACIIASRAIAAADGRLDPGEKQLLLEHFQTRLQVDAEAAGILEQIVDEAMVDSHDLGSDVDLVADLVEGHTVASFLLIYALACEMANADGEVDDSELSLLKRFSSVFCLGNLQEALMLQVFADLQSEVPIPDSVGEELIRELAPPAFSQFGRSVQTLANEIVRALHRGYSHDDESPIQAFEAQTTDPTGRNDATALAQALKESPFRLEVDAVAREVHALPEKIIGDVEKQKVDEVLESVQDSTFKIAVVGTFSSGKSTFLNALTRHSGQDMFPTSPIPCTATVNVLRHGAQERYFKRDKSGNDTEIGKGEFRRLVELPENIETAAAFKLVDTEALVVEYPIDLCADGVELIDSPGLDENERRTEITETYLRKADAVILLMNANHLLDESERWLITHLTRSLKKENLFFVVNYFDQVEPEQREKVKGRARSYLANVYGNEVKLLESRLHFVSAKKSIEDYRKGSRNSYWMKRLEKVEKEVGRYISDAAGDTRWRRRANQLMAIVADAYIRAHQLAHFDLKNLEEALEARKHAVADVKRKRTNLENYWRMSKETIRNTQGQLMSSLGSKLGLLLETTTQKLVNRSPNWSSDASPLFGKSEIIADYQRQLSDDIKSSIQDWIESSATVEIETGISGLLTKLNVQFRDVRQEVLRLEKLAGGDYGELAKHEDGSAFTSFIKGAGGFLAGGPMGALVGTALEPQDIAINAAGAVATGFTLAALGVGGPVTLVLGVAAIGAVQLLLGKDRIREKLRKQVLEAGLEQLPEVFSQLASNLTDQLTGMFDGLVETVDRAFQNTMGSIEAKQQEFDALLRQAQSNRTQALAEMTQYGNHERDLLSMGTSLERVGTVTFETVLGEQGFSISSSGEKNSRSKRFGSFVGSSESHGERRTRRLLFLVAAIVGILGVSIGFYLTLW